MNLENVYVLPKFPEEVPIIEPEEKELKETELVFSDEDNQLLTVLRVDKVLNLKINIRKKNNEEIIKELSEIESEDLEPIKLGFVTEDIEFNGINLKDKIVLVDGEHRLTSRIEGEHGLVKAFVKKYSTIKELRKDAFTMNINHGLRLSKEEIQKMAYEIIKEAGEESGKINALDISKEYSMNRDLISNMECKIRFENIFVRENDTAN